jgi:hypothetical protein
LGVVKDRNIFLKTTRKVCATSSRTSYKIVPLTNLNKYLYSHTNEIGVDINISVNNCSEKLWKENTETSGKIIIAVYASFVYAFISCTC